MERISLKAYGKINIGLDITGRRDDGYHLVKMVMQTVDVYDSVSVKKIPKGIELKTSFPFIPNDERNLAFKAAKLMLEKYSISGGVRIDIKKRIPVGGGMAGGSTDGAAVITAIDKLYGLGLTMEEKDSVAIRLGADVPFCLRRGTYLAEGIGEKLTELEDIENLEVLILAPGFSVSTKWAYETYDGIDNPYHPDIDALVAAINDKDNEKIFENMGNTLEQAVVIKHPEISEYKETIKGAGAKMTLMSGSGSTVFGLFDSKKSLRAGFDLIKRKNKNRRTKLLFTDFIKGE